MSEPVIRHYGPKAYADHPPSPTPTTVDNEAKPDTRLDPDRPDPLGDHRARGRRGRRSRRRTPTSPPTPGPGAPQSASGSSSPGRCSTSTGGRARHRRRDLAAERQWPLCPLAGDRVSRPARPQLPRGGPVPHRRRRRIPVHDDQARPLPWGNHPNAWRPSHITFLDHGTIVRRGWSPRCTSRATP